MMRDGMRSDGAVTLAIGVIGGLFIQPILDNLLPGIGLLLRIALFLICALGAPVGYMLAAGLLPRFKRFMRFALVGALNTAIDLGILNLLLELFGQRRAYLFPLYATLGFFAATLNSYFWNRTWTFEDDHTKGVRSAVWFYAVSTVGFFVNVGLATGLARFGTPPGMTLVLWENIAKIAGIAASLAANFLGYKYLVFSKKKRAS
jgi:putative flippase GtrA